MAWTLTDDLDFYVAAAGDFLRARPVANTILLSVVATLQAQGTSAYGSTSPLFGWWRPPAGAVEGVLLVTPPFPVVLTGLSAEPARLAAEALAARYLPLSGVNADRGTAAAFAAAWRDLTGADAKVHRRSRLFRLDRLVPPDPFPRGSARVATAPDRDLLESWFEAFGREVHELGHFTGVIDDRLSYGGLMLWESGGIQVAMAGATRTVAGVARVGPVYTPPDQRKRGYGGAVTVAASEAAVEAGATEVVLFTDLANPTSNALYQRLGYRPLEDSVVLSFAS